MIDTNIDIVCLFDTDIGIDTEIVSLFATVDTNTDIVCLFDTGICHFSLFDTDIDNEIDIICLFDIDTDTDIFDVFLFYTVCLLV